MNIRANYHAASGSAELGRKSFNRARLLRRGALIALSSLGSFALLGCGREDAKTSTPAARVVRAVQIDTTRHGADETTYYTGVVRARFESNLGFRVAGKVAERLVN